MLTLSKRTCVLALQWVVYSLSQHVCWREVKGEHSPTFQWACLLRWWVAISTIVRKSTTSMKSLKRQRVVKMKCICLYVVKSLFWAFTNNFSQQFISRSWYQSEQCDMLYTRHAYWWDYNKWEKTTLIGWTQKSHQINQQFACGATEDFIS